MGSFLATLEWDCARTFLTNLIRTLKEFRLNTKLQPYLCSVPTAPVRLCDMPAVPGGAGRPGAPPGSGMAGPDLGGGGRRGGGGRLGGPGPPAFFGGRAGVGESPGRGARAGGESPRDCCPEKSWGRRRWLGGGSFVQSSKFSIWPQIQGGFF